MSLITFDSISKSFGDNSVLDNLDLQINNGDLGILYGGSASGKSVLLRLLVGLETPDSGSIYIRGVDAATLAPGESNIGYVPQSFALFPDKTVRANIAYPLSVMGQTPAQSDEAVERVGELLGIAHLLDRKPDQLSGGQKQRVAIARGLVRDTEIFVLDDPLVGLDFKLRERLVDDLRATRDALGATFIYATSDAGEALALGSRIAVLSDGKIVEHGTPEELYQHPSRFETMTRVCFPAANVVEGTVEQSGNGYRFVSGIGAIDITLNEHFQANQPVVAVVRGEHIDHQPISVAGLSAPSQVVLREDLGAEEIVYLKTDQQTFTCVVRADAADLHSLDLGHQVNLHIRADKVALFSGNLRVGQGRA